MKKTPLYEKHCQLGGKMINFGGWALPVQYAGILEEHQKVRAVAGLFDVSHMGEITVKGPDATNFLQKMLTNDITGMAAFQVLYSPMCYHDGGVVDDLLVYKFNDEEYLLVVNAANTEKDFRWLKDNLTGQVEIAEVSAEYAQLALQGPKAEAILQKLTEVPLAEIRFFHFRVAVDLDGVKTLVSRTGYTGEDGFEIYCSPAEAPCLWEKLLTEGQEEGLVPVGLGARDTLRFEAALPLYGQEIARDISPLEAGLEVFVKLDKEDFTGKEALARQKEQGLARKLVGFEMSGRGVARSHYEVQSGGEKLGFVTTGSFSPSLKKNLGLALIKSDYAQEGAEIEIIIRNKAVQAKIINKRFYVKRYKK